LPKPSPGLTLPRLRLLRAGADPSKKNRDGDTPLQDAVRCGKTACVAVFDRWGIVE